MTSQNCESTRNSETPTQRLASLLLDQNVIDYIADRRSEGRAWRFIARDISEATGGQVDVTYETLRKWSGSDAA